MDPENSHQRKRGNKNFFPKEQSTVENRITNGWRLVFEGTDAFIKISNMHRNKSASIFEDCV